MGAPRGMWDARGRLCRWPSKRPEQQEALRVLAANFLFGRFYTEKEVGAILEERHTFGDYFLLRRELAERGLLCRLRDGSRYWRGNFFTGVLPGAALRRVTPEDAQAVWDIDRACADYAAYSGRPPRFEDAAAVAGSCGVPPGGDPAFFHARLLLRGGDDLPAGYLAYYLGYPQGREAFIASLFLRPASRRQGLGAAVTEAFAAQAKDAGLRALHVGVMTENAPGIAFWVSRGFVPAGRISPYEDTGKFAERYTRFL